VPYPNFPGKHTAAPLVTPQRYLDDARASGRLVDFTPPRGVLMVYRRSLMARLVERYGAGPPVSIGAFAIRSLPATGGLVGLVGDFGIGGPVVSIIVEELAALGVTHFFSFGLAGGLQSAAHIGDIVICTDAIRDEGVSHHYLPPQAEARPSPEFTASIARALARQNVTARRGATWTIDTPYRETADEVRHYRAAGVLTVEMEAAALFAVAAVRGVQAAAAFVLSDLLGETEWTPAFAAVQLNDQLQVLAEAGIEAIVEAASESTSSAAPPGAIHP
jgi:uridine phosphorylase